VITYISKKAKGKRQSEERLSAFLTFAFYLFSFAFSIWSVLGRAPLGA
jgi:hypothetical protein